MRSWKYNILIFIAFLVLGGLFAFTNHRNLERKIVLDNVIFTTSDNLFVDEATVNKLLIQKRKTDTIQTKEALVLNKVESNLKTMPHVKDAQVYMSVNGLINTKITPRKAIGRLYSGNPRYIDETGFEMPLVKNYAERVPLVFNYKKEFNSDIVILLNTIDTNDFLKKLVVGVYCEKNNGFHLKLRNYSGKVQLGTIENLNLKIKNFKGFYAKAIPEKLFDKYQKINLEIANQVVCTKL